MDEGYEALTLMQTGKSQIMPLVLIDRPGGTYWRTWDRNVREHLLRNKLISPEDLYLYQITDDTDQAVRWITRFYRNFHSTRFIKDLMVIRLKSAAFGFGHRELESGFRGHRHGERFTPFGRCPMNATTMTTSTCRASPSASTAELRPLRQMIDVLNAH